MITVDLHELSLKPGYAVLDAGCGSGRHLRALAKMPGLKIFGIDRNPSDVESAVKALREMPDAVSRDFSVTCADVTNLPFDDEFFDCVICSEVLDDSSYFGGLRDQEGFWRRLRSALRELDLAGADLASLPSGVFEDGRKRAELLLIASKWKDEPVSVNRPVAFPGLKFPALFHPSPD